MVELAEYRIRLLAGSGRGWVPCPFGLFNEGEPRRRLLASCERMFRVVGFFAHQPEGNAFMTFMGLAGEDNALAEPVHLPTFARGLFELPEFLSIPCPVSKTLQVDLEGDLRAAAIVVTYV
jgi:hypothetical protein